MIDIEAILIEKLDIDTFLLKEKPDYMHPVTGEDVNNAIQAIKEELVKGLEEIAAMDSDKAGNETILRSDAIALVKGGELKC